MSTVVDYGNLNHVAGMIDEIGGDGLKEANLLFKSAESSSELDEFITRRVIEREPLAYIIGYEHFRGLKFKCDTRALIPRQESETLVEAALDLPERSSVVDVGTGTGAIALAIKHARPDLAVTGTDISKEALDLACVNQEALGLKVDWKDADLLNGIRGEFDAVVADLPYLAEVARDTYALEMVKYEPPVALWGGQDGLDLDRRLLEQLQHRPETMMVALEVEKGTHDVMMSLMREYEFPIVYGITDSRGDIRCIVGKR